MGLTLSDLKKLPEYIQEIEDAANQRASGSANARAEVQAVQDVSTWEGGAATAAKDALAHSAKTFEHSSVKDTDLASAASDQHQQALKLRADIYHLEDYADTYPKCPVNLDSGVVSPPDTSYMDEAAKAQAEKKYADLQADVASILSKGQAADAAFATLIKTSTGDGISPPKAGDPNTPPKTTEPNSTPKPTEPGVEHGTQDKRPDMDTHIGNLGDGIERAGSEASQYAAVPKQASGLGPTQGELNRAAERASESWETIGKVGKPLGYLGMGMEAVNGWNKYGEERNEGKSVAQAATDVAPATAGSIAGGWAGAAVGAEEGGAAGAALGSVIPGVGTVAGGVVGAGIGAIAGGLAGSELGKELGHGISEGLHDLFG
ncbi:hypothetical protein ABIA30_002669 [Mycobacterium sp. MAA66]|uniref:hypothetical protein n=1 Tax=Mycobacterium sp. MAA66 TaxID=3156297 RepID=UPI003513859E